MHILKVSFFWHWLQVLEFLLMSRCVESGVFDRATKRTCSVGGPSGAGLRNTGLNQQFSTLCTFCMSLLCDTCRFNELMVWIRYIKWWRYTKYADSEQRVHCSTLSSLWPNLICTFEPLYTWSLHGLHVGYLSCKLMSSHQRKQIWVFYSSSANLKIKDHRAASALVRSLRLITFNEDDCVLSICDLLSVSLAAVFDLACWRDTQLICSDVCCRSTVISGCNISYSL